MNLDKIKELITLAKDHGIAELSAESGGEKYCVKMYHCHAPPMETPPPRQSSTVEPAPQKTVKDSSTDGLIEVSSPFVGTFYRSSSPEADPYVSCGEKVSPGRVLCIIEAMKIMNEIESEISGEIVEICIENETYVEYGQVLFKIRPS